ncbi:MAG: mercuric transport protein MerTP [Bacteroidota bacterium]|nr:mercuric transport protein MerTP [Bacteroidota bacterium]
MKQTMDKGMIGAGVLSALAASLCCITPVLALLSGVSGLASTFSWLDPLRPWLIALSVGLLGFAWYQKLRPRSASEVECACEDEGKTPFLQGRTFLGIVTVAAVVMMAFPWYGSVFYPEKRTQTVVVPSDQVKTMAYEIEGMTCATCEDHVRSGIEEVEGVIDVTADYRTGRTVLRYVRDRTELAAVRRAITAAGYTVIHKEEIH